MTSCNSIRDGGSPFKSRLVLGGGGLDASVDPTIESHLTELNRLLGKRIFRRVSHRADDASAAAATSTGDLAAAKGAERASMRDKTHVVPALTELLKLPLTPKRTGETPWSRGSLADTLNKAEEPSKDKADEHSEFISLADYIDMTAELSALKYAFQADLTSSWFMLDENTQAILEEHSAITDYLLAYAYHVMDVEEINGLKHFLLNNRAGAKNIANYAIVSAARTIIDKYKLPVADYNNDHHPLVAEILSADLPFSKAGFEPALRARIDDYVFNTQYAKLIDGAKIGVIPSGIKQLLIQRIKYSPIPIDHQNVNFYLPLFISDVMGARRMADVTPIDAAESDKEFDVQFLADETAFVQISKSAVKCAAQLYYGMVVGDELDVFNTVNYFTHKFLLRGGINIEDKRLRDDLQQYVFSNRFTNLSTGQLSDRTRPAERQMFYRQVFNYGHAQTTDDVIVNSEFPKLWKVLILESAKYLERTQASPNADFFVSRQNVVQAVEDLQYNLSSHCTGMANVITPLIYAECDFVLRRIFMHPEVVRQIVPAGGTWWRVVEALYVGMKNARPKATVLYNKAKLGHNLIRTFAEYNPATFVTDSVFFAFIKEVDRFITTQSILQESVSDSLIKMDEAEEDEGEHNGKPSMKLPEPAHAAASNGDDGWDF